MTFLRTFTILFVLLVFFVVGCGGSEEPSTDDADRTGFITGSSDSNKIRDRNSSDSSKNYSEPEYYTSEDLAERWDDNLDYEGKSIDKKTYKEYMVDPKGPGNNAIKVKIEQVGAPIIYVKTIENMVKGQKIKRDVTLAKLKFKITIENKSKQDCMKASMKLYVYDKSEKRIIDKEQSYFFKDISAGKFITKEIIIDNFYARENKKTKSFDVNFSKVELFVTNTKFYFN